MAHLHAGHALVTRARRGVSFRDLGDENWHRESVDDQSEYPYARHMGVAIIKGEPRDVWKVGDDLYAQAQENPLSAKFWWLAGLSGAGVLAGVGLWALTRSATSSSGGTASSSGSNAPANVVAALNAVEGLSSSALCQTNSTVQAFQTAWNGWAQSSIQVDGDYGTETATAAQSIDPNAPAACTNFASS